MRRPALLIDTDLGRWWDDATALGIANVLHARGLIDLLGVTSNVPDPLMVAAIDAIDTAYGHPDIPLGALRGDTAGDDAVVVHALAARLAHSISNSNDVPDAVDLMQRLLEGRPDGSVTVVGLGAYTNLAALMNLSGDLVAAKVRCLVMMDGLFPEGGPPLTNQQLDPAAARTVVGSPGWPTPIAWVDGFTGWDTKVGGTLRDRVDPAHPMRVAYEALFGSGPPTDGNWDGPSVLYAAFGPAGVFIEEGHGGAARLNEEGGLVWNPRDPRRHDDVYVHVADQATLNARIEELLVATR